MWNLEIPGKLPTRPSDRGMSHGLRRVLWAEKGIPRATLHGVWNSTALFCELVLKRIEYLEPIDSHIVHRIQIMICVSATRCFISFSKKQSHQSRCNPPQVSFPMIRISETVLTSRAERICSLPAFSALVYQGLEPNGDESDTSAATPSDLADELFTGFEDGVA